MKSPFRRWVMVALAIATVSIADAGPEPQQLVVCAPGSPGSTEDAKATMDAFAAALTTKAGTAISAVYDPSEEAGAKRLAAAGLGVVSLPFFLQHEKELGLHARLTAVQKGRPANERWALIAQKGRINAGADLAGFTIVSNAAFAPQFIRGAVLGGLGTLPGDIKLKQSGAVLSALRRAADGEKLAVVADGTQEAALANLPYAAKLQVVTRSAPFPAGLVVTIDRKVPEATWKKLQPAFTGLAGDKAGAQVLATMSLDKFEPVDEGALAAARKAYAGAGAP